MRVNPLNARPVPHLKNRNGGIHLKRTSKKGQKIMYEKGFGFTKNRFPRYDAHSGNENSITNSMANSMASDETKTN